METDGTSFRSLMLRYLRVGPNLVLPMIVYTSRSNQMWFTDAIFQQLLTVLADIIRTSMSNKDSIKRDVGRSVGEYVRNSVFQMIYTFRPTETRHHLLLRDTGTYKGYTVYSYTLMLLIEPPNRDGLLPDFFGLVDSVRGVEVSGTITTKELEARNENIKRLIPGTGEASSSTNFD
ncbi:hypothetical protein SmJEL517_g04379 [Synchytrium microbalum]|uniref:Uncharacterized protein n=1 Tax=Synchytrium microbalum TaxID=1806994 RepID=A0A507BUE4_9FUNG|nr:uncharacterized protein SmJEL517_g04379 [Synchytrium microbalum]TPX32567.1 hypothetical protein SmJEL517_g04379 [Synchytrium microbalum]